MIDDLKNILEILSSVGIDETILEPVDDGGVLIRAVSQDGSIVVYDVVDGMEIENKMGIQSIRGLLSRINLFDTSKVSVEFEQNDNSYIGISFKEGRKKASYRFISPGRVLAPATKPDADESKEISFEKDYVSYLGKAIAAMAFTGQKNERSLSIALDNNSLQLTITDGEVDSFKEELDLPDDYGNWSGHWEVIPFQKVMNKSNELLSEATFTVNDHGVATFDLKTFHAMIAPMAS